MENKKLILIDSIYINNSGGKVLLDYLITTLIEKKIINNFYFLLDPRGEYNYLNEIEYEFGKPSEIFRYRFYKRIQNNFTKVFCFGNVPPPRKMTCPINVYFHNVLLAESLLMYPFKAKVSKYIKRLYIKYLCKNVDKIFVQTNYSKKVFKKAIDDKLEVLIIPFYKLDTIATVNNNKTLDNFVYISNGNVHKNHIFLLKVWELLSKENLYPTLHLTITKDYKYLIDRINVLVNSGLKIINHGFTNVNELFKNSSYLIYPSLNESFGLGLVEGVNANLKVIGADLPYTYEVIEPSMIFNPNNVSELVTKLKDILSGSLELKKSTIVVDNRVNDLISDLLI